MTLPAATSRPPRLPRKPPREIPLSENNPDMVRLDAQLIDDSRTANATWRSAWCPLGLDGRPTTIWRATHHHLSALDA